MKTKLESAIVILILILTGYSFSYIYGDTWTGNSDNQLVTNKAIRNAIDSSVFQLKAGQSVPDDREVPTKSQVLTWLNIQTNNPYLYAKSSNEPVAKRDLTRNYENTAQLYGIPWKGGVDGWNSSSVACASYSSGMTTEVYWDGLVNDPATIYGYFISGLSTTRWYYLQGYAVKIAATPTQNTTTGLWSATLTNVTSCGSGPVSGTYLAEKYYCGTCQFIEGGVTVNGATGLTVNNFYTGNDGYVYRITSTTTNIETPIYISGGWTTCAAVPCQ